MARRIVKVTAEGAPSVAKRIRILQRTRRVNPTSGVSLRQRILLSAASPFLGRANSAKVIGNAVIARAPKKTVPRATNRPKEPLM